MFLLPSEIARLILGYLEEEQLFETYTSFLNECKYLDECRRCINDGIEFRKTIDGKNLKQHLFVKKRCDVSTQTSDDNLILKQLTSKVAPKADNFNDESNKVILKVPNLSPNKSLKRKLSIIKTKSNENLANENDSLNINLDSFIQNLCTNDFAEKLADSINQMKTKTELNRSKEFTEQNDNNQILTQEEIAQLSEVNLDIELNDISLLAESFSLPAYDALFQSASQLEEFFVDLASIEGINDDSSNDKKQTNIQIIEATKKTPTKREYKRPKTILQMVEEAQINENQSKQQIKISDVINKNTNSSKAKSNPVLDELYRSSRIIQENNNQNFIKQVSKRTQDKCRSKFKQRKNVSDVPAANI